MKKIDWHLIHKIAVCSFYNKAHLRNGKKGARAAHDARAHNTQQRHPGLILIVFIKIAFVSIVFSSTSADARGELSPGPGNPAA